MPQLPRAPKSVIAAGVLLIVYGALMLFFAVCGGLGVAMGGGNNAFAAGAVPGQQAMEIFTTVSNLIIGLAMITAGVGVIRLMPIARYVAYGTCCYELIMGFVFALYNVILVFPATERMLAQNNQPEVDAVVRFTMWGSLIFGMGLTLALCVPVILLLSKASAQAAFASDFQGEPPPGMGRQRHGDYYDDDDDYDLPPRKPNSPPDTGIREERM